MQLNSSFHYKIVKQIEKTLICSSMDRAIEYQGDILKFGDILLTRAEFAQREKFKRLVFIHSKSMIKIIQVYVTCIMNGDVPYIYDGPTTGFEALISIYRPNLILRGDQLIFLHNDDHNLASDLCLLLSTSGSTGSSKFVKVSYKNVYYNTLQILDYLSIDKSDVCFLPLSLAYSYGLSVINTHLIMGSKIILVDPAKMKNPNQFVQSIISSNATYVYGVPELYNIWSVDFERLIEEKSPKVFAQAGGKLSTKLIREWVPKLKKENKKFFVMYGQTEASPRISYAEGSELITFPDSIGHGLRGSRLDIQKSDEHSNVGELVYQGPNVAAGYALSLADLKFLKYFGRLKTSDYAQKLSNGSYKIVGRSNRFIKINSKRYGLDDIQEKVNQEFNVEVYLAQSSDQVVCISTFAVKPVLLRKIAKRVALLLHLRPNDLITFRRAAIPKNERLKVVYPKLLEGLRLFDIEMLLTEFLELCKNRFVRNTEKDVQSAFSRIFSRKVSQNDSFSSLQGDSIQLIDAELSLEELGIKLPNNWTELVVSELESL